MSESIREAVLLAGRHPLAVLAVKATAALLLGLLLLRLCAGASAALRHLVAAATFATLLLLPLSALLAPPRVIRVAAPQAARPRTAAPPVKASAPAAAAPVASRPSLALRPLAYGVEVLGTSWLLLSLLAGVVRLRRMYTRAEVSVAGTRLANEMAREAGLSAGVQVAVSRELAVPITFGASHPVILLPVETTEWTEEELRRALRHELEHVSRGDWATHLLARGALALYWPHPLAWVLWRRLRLEAERACDDAVLRGQAAPESYAEQLVALARRLRDRGAVPALSMATRTNLGLRVESILDPGRRRGPRSRPLVAAVALGALAAALTLAPLQVMAAVAGGDAVRDVQSRGDEDEADPLEVALMEAAGRGDLQKMQQLLDRGAKADAAVPGDGSPLIAAARKGRLEAMERLIAAGADVNRGVEGDGSPLINAAQEGHLEAVRLLLDRGADIDRGVSGDGNPLIMAAGDGRLEVVRLLLDRGAAIEKVVPGDENPLIHGSEGGHADVVRLLLERGANVNARVWAEGGPHGRGEWRTALLMARRNRHEEVVHILLAAGARE
jgi:beta-lactamase regulating signal transducer with metallopeptidase domain